MRTWFGVVAAVALVSCRQSAAPKEQAGSGRAAEQDAAKPDDKRKRAEAAIASMSETQGKLAELRGLPLDKPVAGEVQSTDDFRKFVQRELAKELPPEKAEKIAAAQLHIGLLTKQLDLVKTLERTLISQAAAYYDPAAKKMFVVMAPDNAMMLDSMIAHELTHALQDHHFDLAKYISPTLDDDANIARRFVVEGDAMFSMIAFLAARASGTKTLEPALVKLLETQIPPMASTTIDQYAEMMKQQSSAMGGLDADLKTAMEGMRDLPPIIIRPLIDSYMKGAVVSLVAYGAGGWKAVDALYKEPPESTEQVLHPATKLVGKRDKPKQVTLPALPKGDELVENVIGELQWSIYLQQWGIDKPQATEGWGGDRYTVLKREDGSLIGFIATSWDTAKDAEEFADAYVQSLAKRFPGADTKQPEAGIARSAGGKVFVRVAGKHVFIVDGGDDKKLLDQLAKATIK